MKPTVSAIMPVYNGMKYIDTALYKLIHDHHFDEIVVIDDGSTDGTFDVILKYANEHDRIKYYHHPNRMNRGLAASRNLGFEKSIGDYIQIIDVDDALIEGKIERQLEIIEREDADVLLGAYFYVKGAKQLLLQPYQRDLYIGHIHHLLGHVASNLWKRSFLIRIGQWNDTIRVCEDYEMHLRSLKHFPRVCFDTMPSSYYMVHEGSLSDRHNMGWYEQVKIRLALGHFMAENNLLTSERSRILHQFLYNKLILMRRSNLTEQWSELHTEFVSASWYRVAKVITGSPKAIMYFSIGFVASEAFMAKWRVLKNFIRK